MPFSTWCTARNSGESLNSSFSERTLKARGRETSRTCPLLKPSSPSRLRIWSLTSVELSNGSFQHGSGSAGGGAGLPPFICCCLARMSCCCRRFCAVITGGRIKPSGTSWMTRVLSLLVLRL